MIDCQNHSCLLFIFFTSSKKITAGKTQLHIFKRLKPTNSWWMCATGGKQLHKHKPNVLWAFSVTSHIRDGITAYSSNNWRKKDMMERLGNGHIHWGRGVLYIPANEGFDWNHNWSVCPSAHISMRNLWLLWYFPDIQLMCSQTLHSHSCWFKRCAAYILV